MASRTRRSRPGSTRWRSTATTSGSASTVDRFDDAEARDGAARQFEALTRPRSDGVVWTWGPYTLFANGARDDAVMERITEALDQAGAQ